MLSIPHLIIIFVVALVVFGPEKLPELARNLGKVMAEFRRATGDLRSTFEGHLKDLERETDQRRIGGTSAASPSASPAAAPADGTVPTLPPHIAGPSDGAIEVAAEPPHESPNERPHPEQTEEPKSETVSDGGTRPA
ncbi:MAG: Sec-independent protein translocase subunit TatA/TatB [Candidatus Acidiferrales bacterium]